MKNKYVIAFLGTDGSGKSTIINAVRPIVEEQTGYTVCYEHLRPNYLSSLGVALGKRTVQEERNSGPVTDPHSLPPSGFAGSLLRLCYYMIDYTWGYFKKVYPSKQIVWFFDRYYYDYLIDQRRARLSLPQWVLIFFELFVPTPDLILCLGADPEVIFKRKPETTLEEVKRQVATLHKFCEKHDKAVWVDTGTTVEDSVNTAITAIATILR